MRNNHFDLLPTGRAALFCPDPLPHRRRNCTRRPVTTVHAEGLDRLPVCSIVLLCFDLSLHCCRSRTFHQDTIVPVHHPCLLQAYRAVLLLQDPYYLVDGVVIVRCGQFAVGIVEGVHCDLGCRVAVLRCIGKEFVLFLRICFCVCLCKIFCGTPLPLGRRLLLIGCSMCRIRGGCCSSYFRLRCWFPLSFF